MNWSLKEEVGKRSKDPVSRANTELALKELGDSDPERAAYLRAKLNNDVKTVEKNLISRQIDRANKKANPDHHDARYLNFLTEKLRKLEAS